MASTPLNKIEKAHQLYREGLYKDALGFYTEALSLAKTKPQKIALHSNRAACYLKLHHFDKAAEECTSVLELDCNHTGALMLRAQTLVTLKEYNSALFDVNRLIELNPSSEVYQSLQTRLKTQLSLAPIPETEEEEEEEEEEKAEEELNTYEGDKGQDESKDDALVTRVGGNQKAEVNNPAMDVDVISPKTKSDRGLTDQAKDKKAESKGFTPPEVVSPRKQSIKGTPEEKDSKGWQAIPKPRGHSTLDYARWERVEDDSSEEDDDSEEESEPQYRFRVRTVGVQSVK